MRYTYRGIDKRGHRRRGIISAESIEEAKASLRQDGIYLQNIEAYSESEWLNRLFLRQISLKALGDFSRELAGYLSSGMTILTALKLMERQHEGERRYVEFLAEIRRKVEGGSSLYKALADQGRYILPDFYLQSLHVAGERGRVADVLSNMSRLFALQNRIRKQVLNALAYPIFILIVAFGMTGFLIAFVVPKITAIFEDTGQRLPAITRFVLRLSDFFINHYLAILFIGLALIVSLSLLYRLSRFFRLLIDGLLLHIPIIKTLIQNHELARFSYIFSIILDSGLPYTQAVQLSATTFSNEALRMRFEEAAKRVIEGNRLSDALHLSKGVPLKRNFIQSLALGEESSEVASIMKNLSQLYSEDNEDKIKILLTLLEPVMMLLIGAIVGMIVMAMLLPIFSMSLGAKI